MNFLHPVHDLRRVALTTTQADWSYGALVELRDRIQSELNDFLRSGVGFALVMGPNPESIAALLAGASCGRPVVLLAQTLPPDEMQAALDDCRVPLLVWPRMGSARGLPAALAGWRAAAGRDEVRYLIRADIGGGGGPLESLDERAVLCQLTSGSTGASRLAVRSVAGIAMESAAVVHHLSLTPEDTVLVTSSLAHSYALCGGLLASLMAGARVVAAAGVDEATALARAVRPTAIFGLGATYQALMAAGDPAAVSRTRLALSAGAPLPEGLFESFQGWCGVPIRQDYGTTEAGTIALDLGDVPAPETVGSPLQHVTIRLPPPLGASLHPGEQGEVLVRSQATAAGYLDAGEFVPCLDRDGWYRTGDAGSWDGAGRLRLGRRLRAPVMTAGGAVDLDAVEEVVLAMPGVGEAVAVPFEAGKDGAAVRLVAVAPGVTEKALRAWCRARLAQHEAPAEVELRSALPRSPAGKILGKYL